MVVFQWKLNLYYLTMPRVRYDYIDINLKSTVKYSITISPAPADQQGLNKYGGTFSYIETNSI